MSTWTCQVGRSFSFRRGCRGGWAGVCLLMALLAVPGDLPAAGESDLAIARAALSDRLYGVAERHLVRVLATRRDDPQACVEPLLWLCQALAGQGRPVDLLNLLEANPAVAAAGRAAGGIEFWTVRALLDLGRVQEALARARTLAFDPMDPVYAVGLLRLAARAEMASGDYAAARVSFAQVDARTTNLVEQTENLLEWAQAELAAGEWSACETLLQRQAAAATTNSNLRAVALGRLLRAQLLRRDGRAAEAETLFLQIVERPETAAEIRAEAWLELAEMEAATGRVERLLAAEPLIQEAGLAGHGWRLAMRLGRMRIALPDQLGEGVAWLKRGIRVHPGAPESALAQFEIAEAWLAAGSNRQAVAEYRNYLESYGDGGRLAPALRGQAVALLRLQAYPEATALFLRAAQASTQTVWQAECLLRAADASHADQRYDQAADLYARVAGLTIAPGLAAPAAFMAGDALERMGRTREAEAAFAALADAGPDGIAEDARLRLALLHERGGAAAEAIRAYSRVIEATTNSIRLGTALLGRGRTHYRNYQFESAIPDLARVQEAAPALADEAAYLWMLALYGAGRDEDAAALGRAFTEHHGQSPLLADVALWLAQYSYNRKAFDEAQQRLTDFVGRWPGHDQADAALVWAGRAAMQRGEFSETITLLARLPRDYPDSPRLAEARFLQADALCELARFEEAILVFDEIINRYPESESVTTAWLRKGDSLLALGSSTTNRYDEALKAYDVVAMRPDATPDLLLQVAFKKGRCLEKLNRVEAAIDQYYGQVVLHYDRARRSGITFGAQAQNWYARAVMRAAALEETRGQPEAAIGILLRLAHSGLAGAAEAEALVQQIKGRQPVLWPETGEDQQ